MQGRAGTGTRTRRGVLAALLSGGATGALVACGAGSSAPAGGAGAGGTSGAAGEIVYMTPWSGVQLEIMQEVNNLFSQKFPRIKVNVAPQPSNGYDGVVASFAAGAAPDSLWVAGQYGPRLYDSDELIDVTDRFKVAKMDLQKDYISSKLELWQGKLRGVPETVSPHAWYYNKTMLKQAGGKGPLGRPEGGLDLGRPPGRVEAARPKTGRTSGACSWTTPAPGTRTAGSSGPTTAS